MPKYSKFNQNFDFPDQVIGNSGRAYALEEFINCGGNAAVYKGISEDSGDEYAIKILLADRDKDKRRFEQEIEILSRIHHDHIVKYADHGVITTSVIRGKRKHDRDLPFMLMELASSDLSKYLYDKNFQIGSEEYLGQIRGLSSALSELHIHAIHRDIKPGNILVCGERWVLTDFGLCGQLAEAINLTRINEAIGPRYWMSPEGNNKALGVSDDICKSSDVFQLASVFWFIINGYHPTGIVRREDWSGPESLFKVIHDSLHYDRSIRPEDGSVFFDRIKEAISTL